MKARCSIQNLVLLNTPHRRDLDLGGINGTRWAGIIFSMLASQLLLSSSNRRRQRRISCTSLGWIQNCSHKLHTRQIKACVEPPKCYIPQEYSSCLLSILCTAMSCHGVQQRANITKNSSKHVPPEFLLQLSEVRLCGRRLGLLAAAVRKHVCCRCLLDIPPPFRAQQNHWQQSFCITHRETKPPWNRRTIGRSWCIGNQELQRCHDCRVKGFERLGALRQQGLV